jgi:hypothetical protein
MQDRMMLNRRGNYVVPTVATLLKFRKPFDGVII